MVSQVGEKENSVIWNLPAAFLIALARLRNAFCSSHNYLRGSPQPI